MAKDYRSYCVNVLRDNVARAIIELISYWFLADIEIGIIIYDTNKISSGPLTMHEYNTY